MCPVDFIDPIDDLNFTMRFACEVSLSFGRSWGSGLNQCSLDLNNSIKCDIVFCSTYCSLHFLELHIPHSF